MGQRSEEEVRVLINKLVSELYKGLPPSQVLSMAYTIGYDDGFLDKANARRVYQYSDLGKYERRFRSVRQAADYHDVNEGSIQCSIRNGTLCRGKRFSFSKNE